MDILRSANLGVRFALELGALAAFCYWGATMPLGAVMRWGLAILLPAAVALLWAIFISPKARISTGLAGRAGLGLLVFLAAAAALAGRGAIGLAAIFAGLSVVSTILMVVWRQ